jgi:hypothetical protein
VAAWSQGEEEASEEEVDEEGEEVAAAAVAPAATAEPSDAAAEAGESLSCSSTSHGDLNPPSPVAEWMHRDLCAPVHLSAKEDHARRTAPFDAGETCGAAEAEGEASAAERSMPRKEARRASAVAAAAAAPLPLLLEEGGGAGGDQRSSVASDAEEEVAEEEEGEESRRSFFGSEVRSL